MQKSILVIWWLLQAWFVANFLLCDLWLDLWNHPLYAPAKWSCHQQGQCCFEVVLYVAITMVCEKICKLILSSDMMDLKCSFLNYNMNKIKIYMNVLHSRVLDKIEAELCGAQTVTNWNNFGDEERGKPSSVNTARSRMVSDAAFARALYSASVNDLAIALFF